MILQASHANIFLLAKPSLAFPLVYLAPALTNIFIVGQTGTALTVTSKGVSPPSSVASMLDPPAINRLVHSTLQNFAAKCNDMRPLVPPHLVVSVHGRLSVILSNPFCPNPGQ